MSTRFSDYLKSIVTDEVSEAFNNPKANPSHPSYGDEGGSQQEAGVPQHAIDAIKNAKDDEQAVSIASQYIKDPDKAAAFVDKVRK